MKRVRITKPMRRCLLHVWDEGWSEDDWHIREGYFDYTPHWRTLEGLVRRGLLEIVGRRWKLTKLGTRTLLRQLRRRIDKLEDTTSTYAGPKKGMVFILYLQDKGTLKWLEEVCESLIKELQ